ncbi:MAG TPA: VWA domain-containing protein [Thermodesulfobacteriota bacterium]|nr:VWA domain-containing protein [Thermodesulfobacteriota bacterium]
MKLRSKLILLAAFLIFLTFMLGSHFLVAFPTIPKPGNSNSTNSNTDTVFWDVKLSHPFVEKSSNGDVLVNFNIKGQEVKAIKRAPVNLVLVIDRSGSMSEAGKLEYAKEAAKRIISGLGSNDRIGIVAYSTDVELLYPIQFLKDKDSVTSVVDSLYPTDSTNLSGGLVAGIDQLKSLSRDGYINRVILLSDGLANVGITDIGELSRIASGSAENGIHITTLGLGLNYDENLMMNLAEYGAGNYYFIESPTQLVFIFEKEFGQILATVAKDSTLYLSLAPQVQLKEVYGYVYTNKDGKVQVKLGDFFSGQERNMLIKLNAPTGKIGKHDLITASFEFSDVLKNSQPVKLQGELAYEVTQDKNKVVANENKGVTARGISVGAGYDMYQATTEYEKGNRQEALSRIKAALSRVVELNKSPQKSAATVKQEEELHRALGYMSDEAPAPESDDGKRMIKDYKAKAREQQK